MMMIDDDIEKYEPVYSKELDEYYAFLLCLDYLYQQNQMED